MYHQGTGFLTSIIKFIKRINISSFISSGITTNFANVFKRYILKKFY